MPRRKMTKARYLKRMKQHEAAVDRAWMKIAHETNEFIRDNPNQEIYNQKQIESFIDSLCLKGAWISDRLRGLSGLSHNPTYRRSLSKKIRNILGYTY